MNSVYMLNDSLISNQTEKHTVMVSDFTQAPSLNIKTMGSTLRWGWALRGIEEGSFNLLSSRNTTPKAGDVALFSVKKVGYHKRIRTASSERLRLYEGDFIVGVFGNRYATDAYEGLVENTEELHLLTSAGMVGTFQSRNSGIKAPTVLSFEGYLTRDNLTRVNTKKLKFNPEKPTAFMANTRLIMMVGTGMNSGKTTTSALLVKSLLNQGYRVAACKLTGSVSPLDRTEMQSTGAQDVRDFSDYGFPSTYLCEQSELRGLFFQMVNDALDSQPDFIVMEVADGVLQRETTMLLKDVILRPFIDGVVMTAPCALSALHGVQHIHTCGNDVIAVSGIISNAPLFVREFKEHNTTPVASSRQNGDELATCVLQHLDFEVAA